VIYLAKKYYVVWTGRRTGVFTDWETTRTYVDGFAGARFKSFSSRAEAEDAFRAGAPLTRRAPAPSPSSLNREASDVPLVGDGAVSATAADVQIYCDGACDPNPGRAGSGIAVYRAGKVAELWYGLFNPNGTNNTAELNALHHALLMASEVDAAGQTAQILCDSTYAINCISKWAAGWKQKGWRKAGGEIKNLALIQAAHEVYGHIESRVRLIHVSAHVGTEGNELADRMAMYAVQNGNEELKQYPGEIDVRAVLRMRAG